MMISVPAYARRPRSRPISLVAIHATRGFAPMGAQFDATVNHFRTVPDLGGWSSGADVLVGAAGEIAEFGDWRATHAAFAAGYGFYGASIEYAVDEVALSIEVAQPAATVDGVYVNGPGLFEPFTDAAIQALADFLRPIVREFEIPLVNVGYWDQRRTAPIPRGFIGHDQTANGRRLGKSDPGALFPYEELFRRIQGAPAAPAGGENVDARPLGFDETLQTLEATYSQFSDVAIDQRGGGAYEVTGDLPLVNGQRITIPPGGKGLLVIVPPKQ